MTNKVKQGKMNTRSDELQTSIITCIACREKFRSNIISAFCSDCEDEQELSKEHDERYPEERRD